MDASQWSKVMKNSDVLKSEVDSDELIIQLVQLLVLPLDYRKKFRHYNDKKSNEEQIETILDILKGSPPEKEPYKNLLKALRSSEFQDYVEIADRIEATETESDSSVLSKVDPKHYEDKVSHVLHEHFKNKDGQTTSLEKIKSILNNKKVFETTPWSDDVLIKFVCKVFAGVDVAKEPGILTERIVFKNLLEIGSKDERLLDKATQKKKREDQLKNMPSMSPGELARFLKEEIQREEANMSTAPFAEIEKEEISGKIFIQMKEDDLEKVMPSSTFGLRRVVTNILERYRKQSIIGSNQTDRFRPFDSQANSCDYYVQGHRADFKIQSRTKLAPIRNFHLPEFRSIDDIKDYIIMHCAYFAAACINDRQNGSIHFGISPHENGREGTVVGLQLSQDDIIDINQLLLSAFFSSQHNLIKASVRNVQFVPVFKDDQLSPLPSQHNVIEFDIVPGNLPRDANQYVKVNQLWKAGQIKEPVFVFSNGKPSMLPPDDVRFNTKLPCSTINQRQQEEYEKLHRKESDGVLCLRNHLTGGTDKMEDDIHKIILLSSINHASEDLKSLEFIQSLQPDAVFDFNPKGYDEGVFKTLKEQEEVLKVVCVDDFHEKSKTEVLKKELNGCSHTHWVFCNGYKDVKEMDAIQWNIERGPAFRQAFYHYLQNCNKDRLLIIMCLFSQSEIFVEACDQILQELPQQWILLSRELPVVEDWKATLRLRNRVYTEDLKERCIIGIPWDQVNHAITSWCHKDDNNFEYKIPHSSGVTVIVEKKKINEWSDIEVVFCSDPSFPDDNTLREKQKQVEKLFYSGRQVQWLNFFSDHVCRRKIHDELHTFVLSSLESKRVEYVNEVLSVYLFHEPGAGGTTSARGILWSLRKKYRCCVLKQFTEETPNQFKQLFVLKDDNPKPLLVLIDNESEETLSQILGGIKKTLKESDISCPTFCVLLICFRTVFVPLKNRKLSAVKLEQTLCVEELSWFENTYKDLNIKYNDPKSLISFNILKENFDRSYIEKTIKEFVKDIKDPNEEVILKFVSLINTFDVQFKAIPVSCFDVILKLNSKKSLSPKPSFGTVSKEGRKTGWEANVSQCFKVLLNLDKQNKQSRTTVRVFNKLIAEQILIALTVKSDESVGKIVLSLLKKDVFENDTPEMKQIQDVLASMVKQRVLMEDGVRRERYSPLILSVWKKEGIDQVKNILTTLFDLNKDPYTAQVIARLHIDCKEFDQAELYANEAIRKVYSNPLLWNTYAQVYKSQMLQKVDKSKRQYTEEELKELIALCVESIKHFRREQALSLNSTMPGSSDESGYIGELESVEILVKAMCKCKCFDDETVAKEITHKYLVSDKYLDRSLEFLSSEEKNFLKELLVNLKKAIRFLDDKYLRLKEEITINPLSSLDSRNKARLVEFKKFFNTFFGEKCDKIPSNLSEEEKCIYRSGMVLYKGANSLLDVLNLCRLEKYSVLQHCYALLLSNSRSKFASLSDFERLLDIVTVFISRKDLVPKKLKFQDIIRWTKQLKEISWRESQSPGLETFMYYALYNFPTEERLQFRSLAPASDLQSTLDCWVESYFNVKKSHYNLTHKDTTLFFLGNGQPLHDIVYQKSLDPIFVKYDSPFAWDSPILHSILRLLQGTLLQGGDHIEYTYMRSGINYKIKIKTAYRVVKSMWWRNNVYFYLGFSFSGLKAYGMTDNPVRN